MQLLFPSWSLIWCLFILAKYWKLNYSLQVHFTSSFVVLNTPNLSSTSWNCFSIVILNIPFCLIRFSLIHSLCVIISIRLGNLYPNYAVTVPLIFWSFRTLVESKLTFIMYCTAVAQCSAIAFSGFQLFMKWNDYFFVSKLIISFLSSNLRQLTTTSFSRQILF